MRQNIKDQPELLCFSKLLFLGVKQKGNNRKWKHDNHDDDNNDRKVGAWMNKNKTKKRSLEHLLQPHTSLAKATIAFKAKRAGYFVHGPKRGLKNCQLLILIQMQPLIVSSN